MELRPAKLWGAAPVQVTSPGELAGDCPPALTAGLGPSPPLPARPSRGPATLLAGILRPAVLAVVLGAGLAPPAAHAAQERPACVQPPAPPGALGAALERILAADADGDCLISGGRWRDETAGLDPLARAIYAYVDYVNPRGGYSLWGASSRGDHLEGGLGVGFTLRPTHATAQRVLTRADLAAGTAELARALAAPQQDQLAADLQAIARAGGGAVPPALIHQAAERLLDQVRLAIEAKERRSGREAVELTPAELLAVLPESSLERHIAALTAGHGQRFYARELLGIDARRRHFGSPVPDEGAIIGEAQQHYYLQLAKRARELALLAEVRALLP